MTPVLVACHFAAKREPDGQYDRLARVLRYTARQHCPSWDVRVEAIAPSLLAPCTGNPSHAWNTAKLDYWQAITAGMPDGTPLMLMDADMMILRPLDLLWKRPFDLAYTVRSRKASRLPLNGGVIALRLSAATRGALAQWRAINREMMENGRRHQPYHQKYAGMNQASFGALLEEGGLADLEVLPLECQEWNCCEWDLYTPETRIVHVKSRLRRAVFSSPGHDPVLAPLAAYWHQLEAQLGGREARSA